MILKNSMVRVAMVMMATMMAVLDWYCLNKIVKLMSSMLQALLIFCFFSLT
jgi:hypothetical protein